MPSLELINISKSYKQGKEKLAVLNNFNLKVEDQEFISVFGPNGCGKTTLLKIIAGLEKPDCGSVLFDGKERASKQDIGFVFQDYRSALYPWRTVENNVSLWHEFKGASKEERQIIAQKILKKVGLFEHREKYPYQLSGGMAQLTAICRTLVYQPLMLLFDEPFSSLDYKVTMETEEKLLGLWESNKVTTIFVSHSIDEAVLMADRVIVLSKCPAKIMGTVETGLPRPRTADMLQSKAFFEKRNAVIELFKKGG